MNLKNFSSRFLKPTKPSVELDRVTSEIGLGQVPKTSEPDSVVRSICGFCSTGCSLDIHLSDGLATNITPSVDYPVNTGSACPKGWEALAPLDSDDRATSPLWRDSATGDFSPIGWGDALGRFTDRFKAIQDQYGQDSVAFISTGQIPTEEMALLGSVAKFGMGIRHGDGNTRQCMASAVVAYKQSFGFDAPPYTYADFDESDVIVLVGSNLAIAHPIMWERVLGNQHNPEIVVIDPRYTETAAASTQHLRIQPDSDLVLFYGLARLLVKKGAVDEGFVRDHTTGFDEFLAHVEPYHLARVAAESGVPAAEIERLADSIASGQRVSFWWTMGVNQSHQGVRTAQAIINLALMTGNIGRPGTGANSVTGQCNAMGSRLFSNTTGLLGGRDFQNETHRQTVADILEIDSSIIPSDNSWSYDQIMSGIDEGKIKGLWVIATNTAHSWIDQASARTVLDKLDFLVVQDMYHTTETAQLADLVLPAAGWGEKDGTFINSERRVGHITKVQQAPGEALADFWIFKAVADAWGCGDLFTQWESPEAAFKLLAQLSVGQPCDFSGIEDYDMLDQSGGIQWPYPVADGGDDGRVPNGGKQDEGSEAGSERRLFSDGVFCTPDGNARFIFDEPSPPLETVGEEYDLVLLTGRGSAAEWHTRTRTSKSKVLNSLTADELYVEIHPDDAQRLTISPNQKVTVSSTRADVEMRALITRAVQPGHVFVPMHFETANLLTFASFDPHSRQPAYKHAAVRISV